MIMQKKPHHRQKMKRLIERCLKDAEFRAQATREEHILFFLVYMGAHLEYPVAPFQKQIFKWTQKKLFKLIVIAAFRGAGKSTICTVSLPLWLILGKPAKKYVVIVARTQEQARRLIANIIKEIEENALLKRDLGPLQFDKDEQRRFTIEIGKYGALIQAVSLDQSIRGFKHGAHRPDAIICDDLEDSDSARTQESRDAVHRRFTGEILTIGDKETDVVVVGNTVHTDGLVLRLGQQIQSGERHGFFGRFPIIEDGKPLWPGKFKNLEFVEEERMKIGDEAMWRREFLLDPRLDTETIVREEWVQQTWYELPKAGRMQRRVIGVDLAYSIGPRSDCTAIVPAHVVWGEEGFSIYILPEIVNARLEPLVSSNKVVSMAEAMRLDGKRPQIFIESMAYQGLYVADWHNKGCLAESVSLKGMSKQERMAIAAQYLQKGVVYFPPRGAELLKRQILGLGIERHDDLADAFTIMILGILEMAPPSRFSIGELNKMHENDRYHNYSPDERKFFFPDHSDDRDGGKSIFDVKF